VARESRPRRLSTMQFCHMPVHPTDLQFLCQVRRVLCYTDGTPVHAVKASLRLLELDVTDAIAFEPCSHALAECLHCPVESRIWFTG